VAEILPLRGLRYQQALVGDVGNVIAPPYDVISAEAQQSLHARSRYNVVRLEFGLDASDQIEDRYRAASSALSNWRAAGVLAPDPSPSFYVYEQDFDFGGRGYTRRAIIARVRLHPWEDGIVLPHEYTLSGPKDDRLQLLRACRTNISPVFALYRPDGGEALAMCQAPASSPVIDTHDATGQAHRLWIVNDADAIHRLEQHFAARRLYVADGHHRYETALTYRDECRRLARDWSDEAPQNFVLMALVAADDPGLLVLPIHRLVRPVKRPDDFPSALERSFRVEAASDWPDDAGGVRTLVSRLQAAGAGGPAFAALGLSGGPALLTRTQEDLREIQMPSGHSAAWRALDVNVLQYGVLEPLLGIDMETLRAGRHVSFTEDAIEALHAVRGGEFPLAFLLNATQPGEIFAVADAGDRMPQKSTYFYPKLATGLVLYPLE
jgi:uncharacterized protein (DUF1015 family)